MLLSRALAAAFEDEIVILDADHGSLLLLDPWAALIWRSCEAITVETVQSSSDGERTRETLQALTDAGLVLQAGDTWIRSPVEWV
jgi:hypothetical protein